MFRKSIKILSVALRVFTVFLFSFCILFIISCESKREKKSTPITFKSAPLFNADSAYAYIENQVAFGPRVPNTKAHSACKNYIVQFFRNKNCLVSEQSFTAEAFDGTILKLTNIIATFYPEKAKRILLCAHWDTRPYSDQDVPQLQKKPIDGANDGASGVGVLMEVARLLSINEQPEVGIDIVLFDGEDYGQPEFSSLPKKEDTWCLGSQYWSKNAKNTYYKAYYGILLDMVGGKNALFAKEGTSMYYAPAVVDKVWNQAAILGFSHIFISTKVEQIVDDHYYINKITGIPTIDIIEYDPAGKTFFGSYWHTQADNIQIIHKPTLQAVGQTLMQTLYTE